MQCRVGITEQLKISMFKECDDLVLQEHGAEHMIQVLCASVEVPNLRVEKQKAVFMFLHFLVTGSAH